MLKLISNRNLCLFCKWDILSVKKKKKKDCILTLFNKPNPVYIMELPRTAMYDLMKTPVIGRAFKKLYKKTIKNNNTNEIDTKVDIKYENNSEILKENNLRFNVAIREQGTKNLVFFNNFSNLILKPENDSPVVSSTTDQLIFSKDYLKIFNI